MKFQLCFFYFILKSFFYLFTEVNGQDDNEESFQKKAYKRLHERAVLRLTASEITIAISDLNVFQDYQVENLQQYFYVGKYPVDFIQVLNKYKTLSYEPIKLSNDEITTLSTNYDDGSKNNRILIQLKLYRKIQEIQCTNYVLLKFILPKVIGSLDVIVNYVYNMIGVSYKGKFVVSPWLWKLHILLLGLQNFTLDTQTFLEKYLSEINGTIHKLITSCRENRFLMKKFDYILNYYNNKGDHSLLLNTLLKMYDLPHKLPIGVERFMFCLNYLEWLASYLCNDISGLAFEWKNTINILEKEIENIKNQYDEEKWTTQPFIYIKCHEMILDILKAKFYSYIWVHLSFYQKTGIKAQQEHDRLIDRINNVLFFAYIDDQIFNEVLILLSDIFEPDDEKIKKTVKVLAHEVNVILRNSTKPNYEYKEVKIDNEYVERYFENDSGLLENHGSSFEMFFDEIEINCGRLNLNILLFYINGTKTTDFVFPNII